MEVSINLTFAGKRVFFYSNIFRWEKSGDPVDIGVGRILKHQSDDYDLSAYSGLYSYLKPIGLVSSSGYLASLPYFDLYVEVDSDAEEEFLCMKDG